MAEDNKPDQEASAQPAAKKKAAAKKAAKKASASSSSKKAAAKKPAAKKAAAKKPAVKKAAAKKPAAKKAASKKSPTERAPVAAPPAAVTATDIPRAVPQPPPTAAPDTGESSYEANDEGGGMSGLLVTAGPLIILAFLILVMSDNTPQERAPRASTASPSQVAVDAPTVTGSGLSAESLKELLVDDAAKDLAEAFKEVGLKLPPPGTEQAPPAVAPRAIELPAELQNNPWAPPQPGQAGAGEAVPPPPPPVPYQNQVAGPGAARGYNPGWGYPGQTGGYNPYMAYPWQPPPGYGLPVNPYWGGAVPGYGVPRGYPPQGAYGNYQPPVPGQWAPNPVPPAPTGAPPSATQNPTP